MNSGRIVPIVLRAALILLFGGLAVFAVVWRLGPPDWESHPRSVHPPPAPQPVQPAVPQAPKPGPGAAPPAPEPIPAPVPGPAPTPAPAPAPPPPVPWNSLPVAGKVARWAEVVRHPQGAHSIERMMEWQYRLTRLGAEAVPALLDLLEKSPSQDRVRAAALRALGGMKDESLRGRLEAWLKADPNEAVRSNAAWALGELGGEAGRAPLTAAKEGDASEAVKKAAGEALRALEGKGHEGG